MPKISVCIPVYNVERYIERCVDSIRRQSLSDIEIIIVNDCTPDNSMQVVERLAREDPRIRIIEHEKNLGLMWARYTAYKASIGEYITFCDSDDYLPENALEVLYNEAVSSKADIVSGNLIYINTQQKKVLLESTLKYGNDKIGAFKSLLRGELRHNLCSKLFRTSLLNDYSYKTYEHFTNGEDGCLFYQVIDNTSKIVHINLPVYYYLQNIESSSQVRYNETAIRSICILNRTRHEIISKYPELRKDLKKCITNIMCSLYAQGYDKDARLVYYLNEFGLSEYLSFSSIMTNSTIGNLARLIIKRLFLTSYR